MGSICRSPAAILLNMNDLIDGPNGAESARVHGAYINRRQAGWQYVQLACRVSTPIFYYNKELLDARPVGSA